MIFLHTHTHSNTRKREDLKLELCLLSHHIIYLSRERHPFSYHQPTRKSSSTTIARVRARDCMNKSGRDMSIFHFPLSLTPQKWFMLGQLSSKNLEMLHSPFLNAWLIDCEIYFCYSLSFFAYAKWCAFDKTKRYWGRW